MISRLRSWWQRIKKPLEVTVIIFSFVILIALIIGYILKWGWIGPSQKTLWDWLQLLIIPAVLALGGYLYTFTTSRNEQKATREHGQRLDKERKRSVLQFLHESGLIDKGMRIIDLDGAYLEGANLSIAILNALTALGDHHSFFVEPQPANQHCPFLSYRAGKRNL